MDAVQQLELGVWELSLPGPVGPSSWRPVRVPGCWEAQGVPPHQPCAWYRTRLAVPEAWAGRHVWLRFGGVSHTCQVQVNGVDFPSHQGMWDAFDVDISSAVQAGDPATVLVKVSKPTTRDGIRGSLTGFLPYVWGSAFGGLWQPVFLRCSGPAVIEDVWARGSASGKMRVSYVVAPAPGEQVSLSQYRLRWQLRTAPSSAVGEGAEDGESLTVETHATGDEGVLAGGSGEWVIDIPNPRVWSLEQPHLYTLQVELVGPGGQSDVWVGNVGLRDFTVSGSRICLNGELIYPRGVLHWGWNGPRIAPDLSRAEIEAELDKVVSLGFNMVKHCLYAPVPEYWQACDRRGVLGWLELPLWLPKMDEKLRTQVLVEYGRILRQVRNHPSLAVVTLGCELSREADPEFLRDLYMLAKELTDLPLVRDNSGSAECYGGNTVEYADFYDYHFYCEPHHFDSLNCFFAPRWRQAQPTLFGEYLDSDTFRDLRELANIKGDLPCWTEDDVVSNPQGVRWEYNVVRQLQRLEQAGLLERSAEIKEVSYRQSAALRKLMLEKTRAHNELSGYVITCISDQPISTSGIIDDLGRVKFSASQMQAINADSILFLDFDRRRTWVSGGDRPRALDRYNHWGGGLLRCHLVLAAGPGCRGKVAAVWRLLSQTDEVLAEGEGSATAEPGSNVLICTVEADLPVVTAVTRLRLVAATDRNVANEWPVWVYPVPDAAVWHGVVVWDPSGALAEQRDYYGGLRDATWLPGWEAPRLVGDARTLLTTGWGEATEAWVAQGGQALLWQPGRGPLPAMGRPFWREAIKLFEPHPLCDAWQHGGFSNLQFYGVAADCSIDTASFLTALAKRRQVTRTPLLTRLDARNMEVSDYLAYVAVDEGGILVCSLRFGGGLGDQPCGLAYNVAGQFMLVDSLRWLQEASRL